MFGQFEDSLAMQVSNQGLAQSGKLGSNGRNLGEKWKRAWVMTAENPLVIRRERVQGLGYVSYVACSSGIPLFTLLRQNFRIKERKRQKGRRHTDPRPPANGLSPEGEQFQFGFESLKTPPPRSTNFSKKTRFSKFMIANGGS